MARITLQFVVIFSRIGLASLAVLAGCGGIPFIPDPGPSGPENWGKVRGVDTGEVHGPPVPIGIMGLPTSEEALKKHLADLEKAKDSGLAHARYAQAANFLTGNDKAKAYRRAVSDGLSTLGSIMGTDFRDFAALDTVRDRVPKSAVGVYYWTTLSYGRTIESLSTFSQPGAAKRFLRALVRLVELDETYFHHSPNRVLAEYLFQAPGFMGGDEVKAIAYALRAAQKSPGYIENHVVQAEIVDVPGGARNDFKNRLEKAIAIPDSLFPDCKLEQQAARKRARLTLKKIDAFFD